MTSTCQCRKGLTLKVVAIFLVLAALTTPLWAQRVKEGQSSLDKLIFAKPELRVSQTLTDAETFRGRLSYRSAIGRFRSEYGQAWRFVIDERTGRVNLLDGGAIPFIPGPANSLKWDAFGTSCKSLSCIPPSKVEALAREFLEHNRNALFVSPEELTLDPLGSIPVGNSIYFLRFQWKHQSIPVEGGSVFFVVNNGNLIQVGIQNIGPITLDAKPSFPPDVAWQTLKSYLNGMDAKDQVLDKGTLVIIPITPKDMKPDSVQVPYGRMVGYILAYRLAFRRSGVIGTWEALVDAHSGELLRFVDTNRYGHVQGGVYKTDKPATEVTVPFPYADYGAGIYADASGNFGALSGTSTLSGSLVDIQDTCGPISMAAGSGGIIDFGNQGGIGTDCSTPGFGGAGNTHASRTQYWNVTEIKMKALSYLPANAWLMGTLTDSVNQTGTCNAFWDGVQLNFFQTFGGCANTGELPGVSLHEWGHGMDTYDGSGGDNIPVETRADWSAILQTHQSCLGGGLLSGNCGGYGNPCTACTGIRDADFAQHGTPTAWTPQNKGTIWAPGSQCTGGSYFGPCGWEDHCESGLATQALWDFVNRDLVGAPTSMDLVSAWQLEDRLFYVGMPQSTNMYTCTGTTPKVSNGCGAGSLYTVMRAVDDDGDGTANGTPHAAAIFAALNRHGIACGAAGDPGNQNQTSCPSLTTPTLTATATSSQVTLNWTTGGVSATRYFVYRNETSCDAGFMKIQTVAAPTLAFVDTAVAHGVTYYYRVQAATANDSCVSAMSNCATAAVLVAADKDFYVRDWNASLASYDDGAQPSTNPVFYHTSDVWNRATNSPGSVNASGWYPTDNMQAGTGALGNNYAFVRVYRNASGSVASVTAHFFVSPFGTGSAFSDAAATADPVLAFAAGDTEQVLSSGYLWHQDSTLSTHACLAVQISTPDDPYALPSLLGQTPGPGDYIVVEDNNKAQRNLDVTSSLMHFSGTDFALIHNAALYPRDMNLRCEWPREIPLDGVELEVVGGETKPLRSGNTVTLKNMQPGENRWIAVRYVLAQKGAVPITFMEMDQKKPVNGFTVLATPVGLSDLIRDNLSTHVQVFNRLAKAFGLDRAGTEARSAESILRQRSIGTERYLSFMKQRAAPLTAILTPMARMTPVIPLPPPNGERATEAFDILKTLKNLESAARMRNAEQTATEHAALLHRLDALATCIQKAKGDPADILQMVRWQEALYSSRPMLRGLQGSAQVARASQAFIATYSSRSAERYQSLLRELSSNFHETAGALERNRDALKSAASAMDAASGNLPALEKAHRQYLLTLQEAVGPFAP